MYDPDKIMYTLDEYLAGLRYVESGSVDGDYEAVNASSGAFGAYQITPKYMDYIVSEAGENPANIADPAVQDRVAEYWARLHYSDFGNWDLVGVAWHAGASNARLVLAQEVPCLSGPAVTIEQIGAAIPGESSYVEKVRTGCQVWRERMLAPDYSGLEQIVLPVAGNFYLQPVVS